jgi:hypothetical protein
MFPYGQKGDPVALYSDPMDIVHIIGAGGPATVHSSPGGMVVEYGYSSEPWVAEFDCDGGVRTVQSRPVTQIIESRLARLAGERGTEHQVAGGVGMTLTDETRLPSGFMSARNHIVILETSGFERPLTEIKVYTDGALWREIVVPFKLSLDDYQPGVGVVLSLWDPFPQVVIVDETAWWEWLLGEVTELDPSAPLH